jgi:hypothetical protein
MFKKKEIWTKPFSEKIAKRVKKIPTGELTMWVDQAMLDLGRCLSQYERDRENKVFLEEALVGAEAIHAVVDELHARMTRV